MWPKPERASAPGRWLIQKSALCAQSVCHVFSNQRADYHRWRPNFIFNQSQRRCWGADPRHLPAQTESFAARGRPLRPAGLCRPLQERFRDRHRPAFVLPRTSSPDVIDGYSIPPWAQPPPLGTRLALPAMPLRSSPHASTVSKHPHVPPPAPCAAPPLASAPPSSSPVTGRLLFCVLFCVFFT